MFAYFGVKVGDYYGEYVSLVENEEETLFIDYLTEAIDPQNYDIIPIVHNEIEFDLLDSFLDEYYSCPHRSDYIGFSELFDDGMNEETATAGIKAYAEEMLKKANY